jgi:hypothetical protein
MKRLAIIINQDEFVLHGSGSALALRGCQRHPSQRLPSGLSLEKLDLIVQGTATQTRALISQLQMLVERMRLGHSTWLALQPDDSAAVYHSRLYAADFNWILGSVQA